jgi:hypothetical protein
MIGMIGAQMKIDEKRETELWSKWPWGNGTVRCRDAQGATSKNYPFMLY